MHERRNPLNHLSPEENYAVFLGATKVVPQILWANAFLGLPLTYATLPPSLTEVSEK